MPSIRKTLFFAYVLIGSSKAMAGMTSYSLTEIAEIRLDALSFFLIGFAFSALILRWAWNLLARDFAWMPRLRYSRALAALVVSGLFVYVSLSLIAGARELMTPGAWVRTGSTHRLAAPERNPKPWLETARRVALENLRDHLWEYAAVHDGTFPANRLDPAIPESAWTGAHPQGDPYGYIPGGRVGGGSAIIVFEPDSYGPIRFVLLENGNIAKLTPSELGKRIIEESKSGILE